MSKSKPNRPAFSRGAYVVASAVALTLIPSLRAADTWTNLNATGSWTTNTNWADGTKPLSSDAVTFPIPGPASHVITLPGPPTAGSAVALSLTFDDSYTLNGGQIDMAGAPINVASGKTATINSTVGSGNGLTKTGTGTLVLGGTNTTTLTASGDLHINAGTVRVSSDANLGSVFKIWNLGTLEANGTFSSAKRIEPSNGTIRVTASNTLSLTANDQFGFSPTDALYKDGDGTLRVTGHSSRFGTSYLLAGTTRLEGDMGYGAINVGNATLEVAPTGASNSNVIIMNVSSIVRGIGTVAATNVQSGSGDISPTLAAGPNATDIFSVGMSTFSGTINSTVNITGPGTVKLTGSGSNYVGAWNIISGTLRASISSQLGIGISAISVGNGGTMLMEQNSLGRPVNLGNGSSLRGTGAAPSTSNFLNVAASANITLGTLLSTDVFTITGNSNRLNGGSGGVINVDGPGVVAVSAPEAYTGAWNLTGGTLRLLATGALGTGTGPVTINSGAMLEVRNSVVVNHNINFNADTIRGSNGGGALRGITTVASGASVGFDGTLTIGDTPNDLTGGDANTFIHITGQGTTTLTQPSDVTATWMIDSSALAISDDAQLGAAGNLVSLNGNPATLRTMGAVTSARAINVAGGTFDSNGFDSSFGNVSGTTGTLLKNGLGKLEVNNFRVNGLSVANGMVRLAPGVATSNGSSVTALTIGATQKLDLTDHKLIVTGGALGTASGGTYSGIQGLIQSGLNGGTWDGAGILTSMPDAQNGLTTLAAATAGDTGYGGGNFAGISVVASDVLVMYTYAGDANLDGMIDGSDYFFIDSNVGTPATGYANGDFNYDGSIDGTDYFFIDSNITLQGAPFSVSGGVELLTGVAAVPEPASFAVMAVIGAGLLSGRRRR